MVHARMMMNIWTSITSITLHPFLSSYHCEPNLKVPSSYQSCTVPSMEPFEKLCQAWLDRWCLRCPFGISIYNTFNVTEIHQKYIYICIYLKKKNLTLCQILWAQWKMTRIPNQSVIIDVLSSRWDAGRCKDSHRACLTPAPEAGEPQFTEQKMQNTKGRKRVIIPDMVSPVLLFLLFYFTHFKNSSWTFQKQKVNPVVKRKRNDDHEVDTNWWSRDCSILLTVP